MDEKDIFEQYDEYLHSHVNNVKLALAWMSLNLPDIMSDYDADTLGVVAASHDMSKWDEEEWDAYAEYFYGERTKEVEDRFDAAWLHHQHNNQHHWQHWVLREDDGGTKAIEMPKLAVIEMVADHWSFSWKSDNLYEIFNWYDKNKDKMVLHPNTKELYESILEQLQEKLDEVHANVNKE